MPNPTTNFKNSNGTDLGNILITKEYLMSVYPQLANQLITPELWVWGRNDYGQIGDNTSGNNRLTPVTTLSGGSNWKQVACGFFHTAAIKTDGTLWAWGRNSYGQIGDNTTTPRSTPTQTLNGGTNWKQVAGGGNHTAAIKTDGTLWTWGYNAFGQLGGNTTSPRSTPTQTLNGGSNWKQVACGGSHTAAIKTDGTLWAWGQNYYGQIGDGTTGTTRRTPVQTLNGGSNWKQVVCGLYHTAAIKTDGTLWTWGSNNLGQIGDNTSGVTNGKTTPTQISAGVNWKQVACGSYHTAAIKTDGTLWTWGNNDYGQIGDGTSGNNRLTPVQTLNGGSNWKQVACGYYHTAAIKTDGTLWTWGRNTSGQIGDNTSGNNRLTPVQTLNGGTNWKQVAGGAYHTAAIRTSDDLMGI